MCRKGYKKADGCALVTGASSGIGREYALQLAAAGYDVILVSNREEENRQVADEIARRVRRLMLHITQMDGAYYYFSRKLGYKENLLYLLYALDDGLPHSQTEICRDWMIPKTTVNTITRAAAMMTREHRKVISRGQLMGGGGVEGLPPAPCRRLPPLPVGWTSGRSNTSCPSNS